MVQAVKPPPLPIGHTFLFSDGKPRADGCRDISNCTELATCPSSYSPPDALGQVERLCGCSIVSLLRVGTESSQEDDVMLHNSQLRVALTELLSVHHQCASQVLPYLHSARVLLYVSVCVCVSKHPRCRCTLVLPVS